MAPSTARPPSLSRGSLRRQSSTIRTGCANERPSGSARGVPRKRYPYRDRFDRWSLSVIGMLVRRDSAVKLIDGLAGESPASAGYPVGTVVISGDGAGDQTVGSPDVSVLDGR